MKKYIAPVLVLLLGIVGVAFAQSWPNIPIVGGAAYCSSTVNATCVNTVPAGPALTGNETVPADTNLSSGANPQTVKMPLTLLNAITSYSYQLVAAGTADQTYTVAAGVSQVVLDVATGSITAAHITAPAAPVDGQTVAISSSATVTTFAFVANTGQTLAASTPTVITASTTVPQGYKWIYRAANLKWYRLQ